MSEAAKARRYRKTTHPRARPRTVDGPGWAPFLGCLEEGLPFDTSARLHGMVPESVEQVMRTDDAVAAVVAAAKAKGEAALVRKHRALAESGERTNGLEWTLERLYPKHWHQSTKLEHSGQVATDTTLEKLRAALEAGKGKR